MAENAPVTLVPASFPEGYCPPNWQTLANDIAKGMAGFVPGAYNFFNYGNSEPGVDDRGKPWFRLNPDGSPDKWYVFFGGVWTSPHSVEAGGDERRMFVGIENDVWAYDGGDGTDPSSSAPTNSTGAMWEVDHNFDFRFPLGAGTSPAPASTTVNVGDTGGEEDTSVPLTLDNVPAHSHTFRVERNDGAPISVDSGSGYIEGVGAGVRWSGGSKDTAGETMDAGESGTDLQPVEATNMPPYRGVFFIKRTSRLFYTP